MGSATTRSGLASGDWSFAIALRAASVSSPTRLACGYSRRPAEVSEMRRVVRSSTRTPRVFSRSATARLTAAFGTASARAAAENPLRSTTLASIANCAGVQIRFMVASIPF